MWGWARSEDLGRVHGGCSQAYLLGKSLKKNVYDLAGWGGWIKKFNLILNYFLFKIH